MAKKTNKQVAEIIAVEGIGYAIMDYLSSEDIRSKEVASDWKIAYDAMTRIEKKLAKEIESAMYN